MRGELPSTGLTRHNLVRALRTPSETVRSHLANKYLRFLSVLKGAAKCTLTVILMHALFRVSAGN